MQFLIKDKKYASKLWIPQKKYPESQLIPGTFSRKGFSLPKAFGCFASLPCICYYYKNNIGNH
jgi:hypothetical protein